MYCRLGYFHQPGKRWSSRNVPANSEFVSSWDELLASGAWIRGKVNTIFELNLFPITSDIWICVSIRDILVLLWLVFQLLINYFQNVCRLICLSVSLSTCMSLHLRARYECVYVSLILGSLSLCPSTSQPMCPPVCLASMSLYLSV